MTVSKHTYSAALTGSPDVALAVKGGSITDDDAAIPKVQATVRIALPAAALLAALDSRTLKRVKVTCGATFPGGGAAQSRVFDLGLRDRDVAIDPTSGDVTLQLASDEAILNDYAQLADDLTPFTYQASLRALIGYALGKIGATLAASPSGDASAQTYADTVNQLPDPGPTAAPGGGYVAAAVTVDTNDVTWGVANGRSYNLYASTATDSYVQATNVSGGMPYGIQAGGTYVFSATGNVKTAFTGTDGPNARRLLIYYRTGSGAYTQFQSPAVPNTINTPTRVSVRVTIPPGTTEVLLRYYHGGAASGPGQIRWGGFRLSTYTGDPTDVGYFDGGTTAGTGYTYAWTGTANQSTSKRTATLTRPVDALRWPAGKSAMEFLRPLLQVAGFRLVCDEARVWTLRPTTYAAPGALAIRTGVNLTRSRDAIRRNSGLFFDGAAFVYTWRDSITGLPMEATDAWATTGTPTLVQRFDVASPYPGPGRAQNAVTRALSRGRELVLSAVSDWTAQAEMGVSAYLESTPIQTGKVARVVWDLDSDEMTVTTRSTDTPAGAIDLRVGTIDSQTGYIG